MSTFISQVNEKDIYAKRAEATRSGVNLEKFTDKGTTTLGILPEGIKTPTEAGDTVNTLATQKYVLDQIGGVAGAMVFKDIVNGDTKVLPTTGYKAGWVYQVAVAGTYAGQVCEVGDMIVCVKDYASGATSNTDWAVVQSNLNGVVIGPSSSVDAHIAVFDDTTGKLIKDGGEVISNLKTKQTAVSDPTPSGTTLTVIDTISQDANGVITPTKKTIQDGTTSQKGVVQLQGSIGASESEDGKAATPKSVRDAINDLDVTAVTVGASKTLKYISETDGKISASEVDIQIAESQVTNLVDDLASKQDNLSFEGTYDASTNKVATESTVSDAIDALDVSAISVGADKTLTSISETDGKISATPVAIQIAESQVTHLTTDLAAKADKVTSATSGNFAGLDSNGNLTDSGSKASDFATSAQGGKADSAIQGVTVNGTTLTPDSDKIVNVPVATASAYGVVTFTTIDLN